MNSVDQAIARKAQGWTLIELSIVLLIIALLSAFAIPSYREQIARGHRLAAVDALQAMALAAEASIAESDPPFTPSRAPSGQGNVADRFVPSHGAPIYRLTMARGPLRMGGVTLYGFILQAAPIENGPHAKDGCGTFVLDATGARLNRDANGQWIPHAEACWRGGRVPAGTNA